MKVEIKVIDEKGLRMRIKEQARRMEEDLEALSNDLSRLQAVDDESSDLLFVVSGEEDGGGGAAMSQSGHTAIFSVRCNHFAEIVSRHSESPTDVVGQGRKRRIHLPSTVVGSPTAFQTFRHFVYTGRLVGEPGGPALLHLARISQSFGLPSLDHILVNAVENKLTLSSVAEYLNQCTSIFTPDTFGSSEVAKLILGFVKEHLAALRERRLLHGLSKEAVIRLIRSNSLDIEENEVWRICVDWARAQVGLPHSTPPKLWTVEQRSQVRVCLDGVVQAIRILHIDSTVFAEEVEPTGAIPIELSLQRYKHAALPDKYSSSHKPGQVTDKRTDLPTPNGGGGAVMGVTGSGSRVECARAINKPRTNNDTKKREDSLSKAGRGEDLSRLNPRVEADPRPSHPLPQRLMATAAGSATRLIRNSAILSGLGPESSVSYYEQLLNSWVGSPNQSWTLIFRASDYAFSAQAFHRMCDGASPSFVLVKADTGI